MNPCSRKRARLATAWKETKVFHPSIMQKLSSQIPPDYKKVQEKRTWKYPAKAAKLSQAWAQKKNAVLVNRVSSKVSAHLGAMAMTEYAELEMAFLKECFAHVNGIPFFHPFAVISRDKDTYTGKQFYLNHDEKAGTEIGIIRDVYEKVINGVKWLCGRVHVPEAGFTSGILDRIENGLVKDVSSTHTAIFEPADPNRTVTRIIGDSVSLVRRGEIEGAKIISIKRHIRGA